MIDQGKNAYGRSFIKRHQDLNDLGVRVKMMVNKAEKRLREMLASHYRLSRTGTDLEHETKGIVKGFCEALLSARILKPDQRNNSRFTSQSLRNDQRSKDAVRKLYAWTVD